MENHTVADQIHKTVKAYFERRFWNAMIEAARTSSLSEHKAESNIQPARQAKADGGLELEN